MNFEALEEIIQNNVEILEAAARDNGVDENIILGVSKFAVANSYAALSVAQKYHFDNCIKPLIENVQCSGYNHEFEELRIECSNTLADDDLVEYYKFNEKYCESCEAQASADAHSKEAFMRD